MPNRFVADRSRRRPRPRRPRYMHARRKVRCWPRRLVATLGVICIVAGGAVSVQIYRYHLHSDRVGAALVHHEQRRVAAAGRSGSCSTSTTPSTTKASTTSIPTGAVNVPGDGLAATPAPTPTGAQPSATALLKVPGIGLIAPVVEGTGEAELSVAVGHVVTSSWPGPVGTSVFEAHDVTWFTHLDKLHVGDPLMVEMACHTLTYRVSSSQVVAAGTPVIQTTASRLLLVTCYPLNALSLTTQRLMVSADLTGILGSGSRPGVVAVPAVPAVPAPLALEAQGLDLVHNSAPMGTLSLVGTPSVAWQQSGAPLDDEGAVITLYFAALRAAEQNQSSWWSAVAPTVPFASAQALVGATVVHNNSTFDPVLEVSGAQFTGASLTAVPVLAGGSARGSFRISMTATVSNGQLLVAGWTITRA
jgi:sortase A